MIGRTLITIILLFLCLSSLNMVLVFNSVPQSLEDNKYSASNYESIEFPSIENWPFSSISFPEKLFPTESGSINNNLTIAVFDTGFSSNSSKITPFLYQNQAEIPDNGIDDDQNGYVDDIQGWNFIDNSSKTEDDNGHGTSVFLTMANVFHELQFNHVKILPIKVLNSASTGINASILNLAMNYSLTLGADVFNFSLEWERLVGEVSSLMRTYYENHNILIFGVTGNNPYKYPIRGINEFGALPEVIAVGSIGNDYLRSYFSEWGPSVEITLPGEDIPILGNDTIVYNGTSYATALASASIAVVWSILKASRDVIRSLLQNTAIDLIEERYSTQFPLLGKDEYYGYGLVNFSRMLQYNTDPEIVASLITSHTGDSKFLKIKANTPFSVLSVGTTKFQFPGGIQSITIELFDYGNYSSFSVLWVDNTSLPEIFLSSLNVTTYLINNSIRESLITLQIIISISILLVLGTNLWIQRRKQYPQS